MKTKEECLCEAFNIKDKKCLDVYFYKHMIKAIDIALKEQAKDIFDVIDITNIEIKELLDKMCIAESEVNHWIDQFYKLLKANLNQKHKGK